MSRRNSKRLVIDACISFESIDRKFNPMGSNPGDLSRKCLDAVREENHIAVFNRLLRREWRDHASRYATEWLRGMDRKNLTADVGGEEFSILLEAACGCLAHQAHRAALAKDFHLVQSALASGQTILSNEVEFPRFVANACSAVPELAWLYYANRRLEGDACRLWIKAGAEKEANRRIDRWAETHLKSNP